METRYQVLEQFTLIKIILDEKEFRYFYKIYLLKSVV